MSLRISSCARYNQTHRIIMEYRVSVKRLARVFVYLYDRFFDDGCSHLGASLAYSTLLTMVPVAMIGVTMMSLFPAFKGLGTQLQHFILTNFVADSANVIATHLQTFLGQIRALTWMNFVVLVLVAILMIYNMVHAFNTIWRVRMQRHLAFSFVIYLGVLLLAPIAFGVVMFVSAYVGSISIVERVTSHHELKSTALTVMPYVIAFLTFSFFNWALPSTRVKWRYAFIAGAVTTVLFECAKNGFVLYVSYFPTYRLIYGALATIPIFLVWIYLTWVIILLGALLCHVMQTGIRHP